MGKIDTYRDVLKELKDWDEYLLAESGLPGPRANLELLEAVAEEGNEERFKRYLAYDSEKAPYGSSYEYLAVCGIVGLGKLISQGNKEYLSTLRSFASDERWRAREGVAIALQRFGNSDMDGLLSEMLKWSEGSLLERRAVVAAICEPKLLTRTEHVQRALEILNKITQDLLKEDSRKQEDFKVLRKTLGYGWSVAVVHNLEEGKNLMDKWLICDDKDIMWIMKENLKKNRLIKKDPQWTNYWRSKLGIK